MSVVITEYIFLNDRKKEFTHVKFLESLCKCHFSCKRTPSRFSKKAMHEGASNLMHFAECVSALECTGDALECTGDEENMEQENSSISEVKDDGRSSDKAVEKMVSQKVYETDLQRLQEEVSQKY